MKDDDDIDVDTHAVVGGPSGPTHILRRSDEGIWLRPTLDSDDEFHMTTQELAKALRILGLNRVDMFPNG